MITEVGIHCNDVLTRRFLGQEADGTGWLGRLVVVAMLNAAAQREGIAEFLLADNQPVVKTLTFVDDRSGCTFEANLSARRLGDDTGLVTRVEIGRHLANLADDLSKDAPVPVREGIRRAIAEGAWPEMRQ